MYGETAVYSFDEAIAALNQGAENIRVHFWHRYGECANVPDEFVRVLAYNQTCKVLDLHQAHVGDLGATGIGSALYQNTSLQKLNLYGNKIGASGVERLTLALTHNKTLRELSLSDNVIGDEGAKHIVSILRNNHSLTELNLELTGIGQQGGIAIEKALKQNASLINVKLGENGISYDILERIKDTIQSNRLRQRQDNVSQKKGNNKIKSLQTKEKDEVKNESEKDHRKRELETELESLKAKLKLKTDANSSLHAQLEREREERRNESDMKYLQQGRIQAELQQKSDETNALKVYLNREKKENRSLSNQVHFLQAELLQEKEDRRRRSRKLREDLLNTWRAHASPVETNRMDLESIRQGEYPKDLSLLVHDADVYQDLQNVDAISSSVPNLLDEANILANKDTILYTLDNAIKQMRKGVLYLQQIDYIFFRKDAVRGEMHNPEYFRAIRNKGKGYLGKLLVDSVVDIFSTVKEVRYKATLDNSIRVAFEYKRDEIYHVLRDFKMMFQGTVCPSFKYRGSIVLFTVWGIDSAGSYLHQKCNGWIQFERTLHERLRRWYDEYKVGQIVIDTGTLAEIAVHYALCNFSLNPGIACEVLCRRGPQACDMLCKCGYSLRDWYYGVDSKYNRFMRVAEDREYVWVDAVVYIFESKGKIICKDLERIIDDALNLVED